MRKRLSEIQIIHGIQEHSHKVERYFYDTMLSYFNAHFNQLFFDDANRDEIFQVAIIKLWTEIENKRITVYDGNVVRQQSDGEYHVMTASLTTFFMTFAKNEYRELLRNVKEDNLEDLASGGVCVDIPDSVDADAEAKARIIDECIQDVSPRCLDIITKYYFDHKSLDEILSDRDDENASKKGLKTYKARCLKALREKILEKFSRLNLTL